MNNNFPDKLRLIDGQLACVDGSDMREYPRAWAEKNHISPTEPISLQRRKDAVMWREMAECQAC